MKFKLKFEIVYDNIDKDIIRDMKIQSLLDDDVINEVVSDVPIFPPNREDIIIFKNVEYIIKGISHIIDNEYYTTLIKIENKSSIEASKRRKSEEEYKKFASMLKYGFK